MRAKFSFTSNQWEYLEKLATANKMTLTKFIFTEANKVFNNKGLPVKSASLKTIKIHREFRIPDHLGNKITPLANELGIEPATLICIVCINPKLIKHIFPGAKE